MNRGKKYPSDSRLKRAVRQGLHLSQAVRLRLKARLVLGGVRQLSLFDVPTDSEIPPEPAPLQQMPAPNNRHFQKIGEPLIIGIEPLIIGDDTETPLLYPPSIPLPNRQPIPPRRSNPRIIEVHQPGWLDNYAVAGWALFLASLGWIFWLAPQGAALAHAGMPAGLVLMLIPIAMDLLSAVCFQRSMQPDLEAIARRLGARV